jgi:long-chain-fatty-acid--CoA ligase ACSBG
LCCLKWADFILAGESVDDSVLTERIKSLAPNKCAILIYTSGTTGLPKAAMISHDNLTYLVRYIGEEAVKLEPFGETFVSYLPLSHIAGLIIDCFTPLRVGGTVYFAQSDALKGSLAVTLKDVRPTYFFGVPRVWEKFHEKIESTLRDYTGIKKSLVDWARSHSTRNSVALFNGQQKTDFVYSLAKGLIINKILVQLGLDRCRLFYSGAAPITKETLDFFMSIGTIDYFFFFIVSSHLLIIDIN